MATVTPTRSKIDGSIVSYRARVLVGRDVNGKQIRKSFTIPKPVGLTPAKEKKEVQRIADELERDYLKKVKEAEGCVLTVEERENITLADFIDKVWIPDHVENGAHTPSGVSFFEYTSGNVKKYFKKARLRDIDQHAVLSYIKYLRTRARTSEGDKLSAYTIYHHFNTLRNVINYADALEFIEVNPVDRLKRKSPGELPSKPKSKLKEGEDFLTPEQALSFIEAIENETLEHRAIIMTMIYTGVRRGELCGLQWGDFDKELTTVTIQRNVTRDSKDGSKIHIGQTKTKETRNIPIGPELREVLAEWKAEQGERYGAKLMASAFVFGKAADPYQPIYPTVPTTLLYRIEERHDLPKVSPHDLRHTFGTIAAKAGGLKAAQMLLGHSDIATTGNFYQGLSEDDKREAVEAMSELIKRQA